MKFRCGETWEQEQARLASWHRRFAWLPVTVGPGDCRWLEFVERRGEWFANYMDSGWSWEYRPAQERW